MLPRADVIHNVIDSRIILIPPDDTLYCITAFRGMAVPFPPPFQTPTPPKNYHHGHVSLDYG